MPDFQDELRRGAIGAFLPHGDEALFLNYARVLQVGDGVSIQAHAWFGHPDLASQHAAHYPGNPILAGHFIIEAIQQAAGLLAIYLLWDSKGRPEGFRPAVGIKKYSYDADYAGTAHPTQDQVVVEVELKRLGHVQCTFIKGVARVGDHPICRIDNVKGFTFPEEEPPPSQAVL